MDDWITVYALKELVIFEEDEVCVQPDMLVVTAGPKKKKNMTKVFKLRLCATVLAPSRNFTFS